VSGGPLRARYTRFNARWVTLSFYERFEQAIAFVLTWLIALIIVVATAELCREVIVLLARGVLDPLDYKWFQLIFGEIMTVMIALEFKHSILQVVAQRKSIIQVRTVVLIALLAISRKFIVLDTEAEASHMFALAAIVVALAVAYRLIRDRVPPLTPRTDKGDAHAARLSSDRE
jgi:uncharacterized membrane protein (DUF373 family)